MSTKKALNDLFKDFTKALADRLESGEVTAADLGVIRQFLKDNNVTLQPGDNTDMERLSRSLPFPANTPEDIEKSMVQ